MLRYLLAPLAALVLLTASLIPDDAYARRGGGGGFRGGGGGFHGAGSVAVAACTRDVSTAAAIVVGCVRHIPSQAARVVPAIPLPVVPVVRATRSRAEGIIADTAGRQWEPPAAGAAAYGAYGAYNNCYDAYGNWI